MKKIIINDIKAKNGILTLKITKNQTIYIPSNLNIKSLNLQIKDCQVEIIDKLGCDKKIHSHNSQLNYFYMPMSDYKASLEFYLDSSNANLNVIDILDSTNNLFFKTSLMSNDSTLELHTTTISSYKNKKEFYFVTNHEKPYTTSQIKCFGIAKDESRITFDIKSIIKKDAFKSSVSQDGKILLLDESASGVNNPILQIDENDVKANHASSIGRVDEEAIYYLTSRGISQKEARNLICLGNISYMLNRLSDLTLREELLSLYLERVS